MRYIVIILIITSFLTGCAFTREKKVYGIGEDIVIVFTDEKETRDVCSGNEGCVKKALMGKRYLYYLYGLNPYSWTDYYAHIINGHELRHLLQMKYGEKNTEEEELR